MLTNGLNLANVDPYVQKIALGVVMAAKSALAIFHTARGQTRGTRRQLVEGLSYARQNDRLRFEFNCLVGLAWLDELEGADASAARR